MITTLNTEAATSALQNLAATLNHLNHGNFDGADHTLTVSTLRLCREADPSLASSFEGSLDRHDLDDSILYAKRMMRWIIDIM